jgi:uncharacterized protein
MRAVGRAKVRSRNAPAAKRSSFLTPRDDKRLANLEKHGVDFLDVEVMFQGALLVEPSPYAGEQRFRALGRLRGKVFAVIYTMHGDVHRIISVRRARHEEREAYREAFGEGA